MNVPKSSGSPVEEAKPIESRWGEDLRRLTLLSVLLLCCFCGCQLTNYSERVRIELGEGATEFAKKKGQDRWAGKIVKTMMRSSLFEPLFPVGFGRTRQRKTFKPTDDLRADTMIELFGEPDLIKDKEGAKHWIYFCNLKKNEGRFIPFELFFVTNSLGKVSIIGRRPM